jgi:hypothetical protein
VDEDNGADEERGWREFAVSNRQRIRTLEREVEKLRLRQHKAEAELAAVTYIAEKVGELAKQVHELATHVQTLSRRALERPTSGSYAAAAGWISAAAAIIALVLTR